MTDLVRLSVNLNQETATAFRETCDQLDLNGTETIRRAIAVFAYITNERAQGHRIMIESETATREIILL